MQRNRLRIVAFAVVSIALANFECRAATQVHPGRPAPHFEYAVSELADLPTTFHQVHVLDVNDAGDAVGYRFDNQLRWRAVHWSAAGVPTDLGGASGTWSIARGISAGGVVGGLHGPTLSTARPCLWIDGVLTYLPDPPHGTGVEVYDVNDAQVAVGRGINAIGSFASQWDMIGSSALAGPESYAFAINELGVAAGFVTVNGNPAAARWDRGVLTVLPDLGSPLAKAIGVNAQGALVGGAESPIDGLTHAVRWENGVAIDLGAYPGPLPATATGINDHGVAAGYYYLDPINEITRAAVWSAAGVVRDLNDLDDPTSGWTMVLATKINDSGWIVGEGTRTGLSGTRGFVAKPQ